MHVVILAAGYGTRLYPLTKHRPKALLLLGRRRLLDLLLDRCLALPGVERVWVVSNHRYIAQFRRWRAAHPQRARIRLIDDGSTSNENRRGAVRDLQLALRRGNIQGSVLVVAGDNYFSSSLEGFLRAARRRDRTMIGLHVVASRRLAARYGTVRLDGAGRISRFDEKSPHPATRTAAMGLYALPRRVLPRIDDYLRRGAQADAPGYFVQWLSSRMPVYGYRLGGDWFDIGDLASYRRAIAAVRRSVA
ncbi:MAG: NTP transferase domain-containing protein [Candidatus Omnitrophica bacterium]|nr:NTP transferase domain-containing protein [Candidatus Omnitrophota bacterium]